MSSPFSLCSSCVTLRLLRSRALERGGETKHEVTTDVLERSSTGGKFSRQTQGYPVVSLRRPPARFFFFAMHILRVGVSSYLSCVFSCGEKAFSQRTSCSVVLPLDLRGAITWRWYHFAHGAYFCMLYFCHTAHARRRFRRRSRRKPSRRQVGIDYTIPPSSRTTSKTHRRACAHHSQKHNVEGGWEL